MRDQKAPGGVKSKGVYNLPPGHTQISKGADQTMMTLEEECVALAS